MAPRAGWVLAAVALLAVLGSAQAGVNYRQDQSTGQSLETTDLPSAFNSTNFGGKGFNDTSFPTTLTKADAASAALTLGGIYGGVSLFLGTPNGGACRLPEQGPFYFSLIPERRLAPVIQYLMLYAPPLLFF